MAKFHFLTPYSSMKKKLILELIKVCSAYDDSLDQHPGLEASDVINSYEDAKVDAIRMLSKKQLEKLINKYKRK